jgi:internalin A
MEDYNIIRLFIIPYQKSKGTIMVSFFPYFYLFIPIPSIMDVYELIEKEKKERTGKLDIGRCGLTELPDELFELTWLEELNISNCYWDNNKGSLVESQNQGKDNFLNHIPKGLAGLINIEVLNISGNNNKWDIRVIEFLPPRLTHLNISCSKITRLENLPENLIELNISDNHISKLENLPSGIKNLTIYDNEISKLENLPKGLAQFICYRNNINKLENLPESLTQLSISSNQIMKLENLPEGIIQLSISSNLISKLENLPQMLTQLSISYNSISKLENLPQMLTQLSIGNNQISKLENLPQGLTDLIIFCNEISKLENLPPKLSNLTIYSNKISKLENLPQELTKLDIQFNQISKLGDLPQGLTYLTIYSNKIRKLENLPQGLSQLSISSNLISKLENLPQELRRLYISNNKISRLNNLPKGLMFLEIKDNSITKLENLPETIQFLNIKGNEIEDITPLNNLLIFKKSILSSPIIQTAFHFDISPLTNPPPEVKAQGELAILKYLEELKKGKDYVFEAKLLIVGESGAGKTTLFRKLNDPNSELPHEDETTKGIDIHSISFPNKTDPDKEFSVNLWDFGGQEIYHATHQFFLTKRSLYILVTDVRKEDTDFNYWLQVIEVLSAGSPVIIVQNEKSERKEQVDLRGLRERFKNIKDFFSLNLSKDIGKIEKLKDTINYHIQKLDHVGQELPIQWIEIRNELRKIAIQKPFITIEEYFLICDEKGIKERDKALFLSNFFHDLGTFIHFIEDPILRHYVFLKNEWTTDAVYALLDDSVVKNDKKGHFDKNDVNRILNKSEYDNMHDEVLQLMLKFALSYRITDQLIEQYVAPQLLTKERPNYEWQPEGNLKVSFQYDFMPKGLMSRLIVKLHRYATNFDHLWRTGAIFYRAGAKAEVVETYGIRNISIRIEGKNKKELLTIISDELEFLSNGFQGLKFEKLVPCNCIKCKLLQNPYYFKNSELDYRLENKKMTIECNSSFIEVSINSLLGDVFADRTSITQTEPEAKRSEPVNFFISYSKSDKNDLIKFKEFLYPLKLQENLITWDDTDLIPTEEWDEKIKKKLNESDIIIFLTSSKSLSTKYILSEELKVATEKYKKKEVLILPIILQDCLWEKTILKEFTALPDKGKPIHSWKPINDGWANVARKVDQLIRDFVKRRG